MIRYRLSIINPAKSAHKKTGLPRYSEQAGVTFGYSAG
jgi:hypothetical protein